MIQQIILKRLILGGLVLCGALLGLGAFEGKEKVKKVEKGKGKAPLPDKAKLDSTKPKVVSSIGDEDKEDKEDEGDKEDKEDEDKDEDKDKEDEDKDEEEDKE